MRYLLFVLSMALFSGPAASQAKKPAKDGSYRLSEPALLWDKAEPGRAVIGLLPANAEIIVESRKKSAWQVRWEGYYGIIDAPNPTGPSVVQPQSLANGAAFVRYNTAASGRRAQPGDVLFLAVQLRHRDSVIYNSRTAGPEPPSIQIPLEQGADPPSPLEDALRQSAGGDSLTLIIPVDSAARTAGFEDMRFLLYDIKVLDVLSQAQYEAREAQRQQTQAAQAAAVANLVSEFAEAYRNGELDGQLERMSSGLQFFLLEAGGGPQVETGHQVLVHYYGMLTDGRAFDNSFERGRPFAFPPGQRRVIEGWEEGVALLREGSKALLFIPPHLAYGSEGAPPDIPPNAELIFYVEVVKTGW